jgi:transposase
VKTAREKVNILSAYAELGSYRAAAALCGTTHKTVRRVVERAGAPPPERPPRPKQADLVAELIAAKVRASDGRISAKRLLPACRAAGFAGSVRSLRRAVAAAKAEHRHARRRYRPWIPVPGEHLVIDWGEVGPLKLFCAVLAWSRVRFVRFAADQSQATTLRLLAECFEFLGGVPAVVLADRMNVLRGQVVANQVVPAPAYLRFAAHYGFRPDFCEAGDAESKGLVENLVGYAKADLVLPGAPWPDLAAANAAAAAWCAEVNATLHSEIAAIPAERLVRERELLRPLPSLRPTLEPAATRKVDRLQTVRFGAARYSVPAALVGERVSLRVDGRQLVIGHRGGEVARHELVPPGEVSCHDAHYGGPPRRPARAVRPRSAAEIAFCALGPVAERFLRAAAAAGTPRLGRELAEIVGLEHAYGRERLLVALERALRFGRFRALDLRSILVARSPEPTEPGAPLSVSLPAVPMRPLSAYALEGRP